jgi:WD40 repeat protein
VKKRILIIAAASVVILGLLYAGYTFYRQAKNPAVPALQAIPGNAALIIEVKDPLALWQKLSTSSDLWTGLRALPAIREFDTLAGRLFASVATRERLAEALKKGRTYICLSMEDTLPRFLILCELPGQHHRRAIEDLIERFAGELRREQKTGDAALFIHGNRTSLAWSLFNGVFVCSGDTALAGAALGRLQTGMETPDEAFRKVSITAGKNVDANIYFHFRHLQPLLERLTSPRFKSMAAYFSTIGQWAELDCILKEDELLLNGYCSTTGTGDQYFDVFRREPQEVLIASILPFNTPFILHYGLEDINSYFPSYTHYLDTTGGLAAYREGIAAINDACGIDLTASFASWTGREMAYVITESPTYSTASILDNSLVVIHATDVRRALEELNRLSALAAEKNKEKEVVIESTEYEIRKIGIPRLLPSLFGPVFGNIRNNFYTSFKDYILFANNPLILDNLIAGFYNQRTLAENFNYKAFTDNIAERSNIYLYWNIRKAFDLAGKLLNRELALSWNAYRALFRNFEGIGLQVSSSGDMYYLNAYLKYNPGYQEINPSNWEATTEARITSGPWLVRDHTTNKLLVIVFDQLNNMYLVDHLGKIKWKISVSEQPLGEVHQVDYYKNGKIQYLFNTANYLYLIDLNGQNVADYPVKLRARSTNGVAVFDYEKNRDYRLMLAGEDNKIYNYDIKGNVIEGWDKVYAPATVRKPIQFLRWVDKDYLISTDQNGSVVIANRRGETRINLRQEVKFSQNNNFYINVTNRNGIIISTDQSGNLVYVAQDGKISRTHFSDCSPSHYFLYEDMNADGSNDFIYLDNGVLKIYTRFKELLLQHEFPAATLLRPVIFNTSAREKCLCVVSPDDRQVFLLDVNGLLQTAQAITGESQVCTGSLNNDGKINLLISEGNLVKNYLIE